VGIVYLGSPQAGKGKAGAGKGGEVRHCKFRNFWKFLGFQERRGITRAILFIIYRGVSMEIGR
jgi:hypothetical protein